MFEDPQTNILSIFQVWYSSGLPLKTKIDFLIACKSVLEKELDLVTEIKIILGNWLHYPSISLEVSKNEMA